MLKKEEKEKNLVKPQGKINIIKFVIFFLSSIIQSEKVEHMREKSQKKKHLMKLIFVVHKKV